MDATSSADVARRSFGQVQDILRERQVLACGLCLTCKLFEAFGVMSDWLFQDYCVI